MEASVSLVRVKIAFQRVNSQLEIKTPTKAKIINLREKMGRKNSSNIVSTSRSHRHTRTR